jgi:hypothetical protein
MRRVAFVASVVALFAAGLLAQNRMSSPGGHAPSGATHRGFAPGSNRNSIGISGRPFGEFRRRGLGRTGSLYWPYFYPGYYSDYYDGYENEPPPPPQAPEPTAAPQSKQEPLPDPVLLELHGNQWVKVTNFAMPSSQTGSALQDDAQQLPKEMPPTVLVYRDGHSEEVTSYSIIGASIYTKSDYWSNGAWTRTIQIADLDIPATLKQNQQRGVKFDLPSGPNEVMIRP